MFLLLLYLLILQLLHFFADDVVHDVVNVENVAVADYVIVIVVVADYVVAVVVKVVIANADVVDVDFVDVVVVDVDVSTVAVDGWTGNPPQSEYV